MDAANEELLRLSGHVRAASAASTALDIRGGNTKAFYGGIPRGEVLDTRALRGISSYEPTELVVAALAGTPLAELEGVLAERGQCLPFEPPRFEGSGTVGGMVAAGLSGPARARVGAARDYVLGVSVLNGAGELLTFGGQVMKNVAGYDVSRAFCGSLGILGVICEVSLKVMPVLPARVTLAFDLDETAALAQLSRWAGSPVPVDASAWYRGRLCVRLTGARSVIDDMRRRLGGTEIDAAAAGEWWRELRDQRHDFFDIDAAALARGECLWRISVPDIATPFELPGERLLEWGGAQRWLRTTASAASIRAVAAERGGHATLVRGADKSAGVFTPLSPTLMTVHRRLKQSFDPAGIFNPGRLYAEF